MRWIFSFIVLVHGLIHLMGVLKASGRAELTQLTQPISRPLGSVWLLAALLCVASAILVLTSPRYAWVVCALAALVSQIAIVSAWHDAKFGSVANLILLLGAVYGFLTQGPSSFRAEYERDVQLGLASPLSAQNLTEADIAHLPAPVQRYVRATGFLGRPRVRNYQLQFRGRIRSAADARWMPFTADQHSFVDAPTRLFWLRATMYGLPVQALHVLQQGHARMHVKAMGALTMVDSSGPAMDRAEAVTLFNDMCILAPGSLVESSIQWEPVDARSVRARFSNGASTISATLFFDEQGLLENFVSDDRSRTSPDGKTFTKLRFSTPVSHYRSYGPYKLPAHGEARWHPPEGEFTYGEFELLNIAYNITR